MKRILSFLFTIAFVWHSSTSTKAQTPDDAPWCPEGAAWTYRSFAPSTQLYYHFAYERDSLLHDTLSKVWSVYQITVYIAPSGNESSRQITKIGEEYLFESEGNVYWYDKVSEHFSFLYSFNFQVGDIFLAKNSRASHKFYEDFIPEDTLQITSVSTRTLGERTYSIFITNEDRNMQYSYIISKIGSLQSPFPEIRTDPDDENFIDFIDLYPAEAEYGEFYEGLVCYSDAIRGFVPVSRDRDACHHLVTNISPIPLPNNSHSFTLYPNPASNTLHISSTDGKKVKEISIYNTEGYLQLQSSVTEHLYSGISISHLNSGFYLIKITDEDKHSVVLKFSKE